MTSAYTNIICNSDIAFLASTYFNKWLTLCIDDEEHFLWGAVQRFEYNEILFRFVNLNNIYNSIVMCNLKREHLFAQFAIKLLKLNNNLASMNFHGSLGFKPFFQAFQMDTWNSTCAVARWYQWIEILVIFDIIFTTPAYSTLWCWLVWFIEFILYNLNFDWIFIVYLIFGLVLTDLKLLSALVVEFLL